MRIPSKLRLGRGVPTRNLKRWGLMAGGALVALLIIGQVVAQTVTVTRDLKYEPCQVDYGQSVAAWDGVGDQAWNQADFHYETKIFKISAKAPRTLFKNVREANPVHITTKDCGNDGLVNFDDAKYQWSGAKVVGARLGNPDLGEVNKAGMLDYRNEPLHTDKKLIPPLAKDSFDRAAAWVDDSATATIQTADSKTHSLWCQDNLKDDKCDVSVVSPGSRGEGYLFVGDNCPATLDCNQSTGWYEGFSKLVKEDISDLVGRNERGELSSFYLNQEAVSQYGYDVGAYTVLTFKYPKKSDVVSAISVDPAKAEAGGAYTFTLTLNKLGPGLKSLVATADLATQPLKENQGFQIDGENLDKLNGHQEVKTTAVYQLTGGEPGKCYTVTINLKGVSVVDEKEQSFSPVSAHYCIQSPIAATYTYDVTTRGEVAGFDEFITQVAQTYADERGWAAAGARFTKVVNGGDFTVVLAAADQMSSFSPGCDANWSCNAGRYVIINYDRWVGASAAWNNAGGSLRDYRHMVVNHETGHWLGFGHLFCPAAGSPAPVMQQQSIDLQGCAFNPWPTAPEIAALKARL